MNDGRPTTGFGLFGSGASQGRSELEQLLQALDAIKSPLKWPQQDPLWPQPSALARALQTASDASGPFGGLLDGGTHRSALANALGAMPSSMPPLLPAIPRLPARRHTFFSFHYGEDVNRATIVRNGWAVDSRDDMPGFFDRSLWEESKKRDPTSLRRMIRKALEGTTVTCVLAGRETYARPWVRLEIAESVARGNGFVTAHIWPLTCIAKRCVGTPGPDPLNYMAVSREQDGKAYLWEWNGSAWVRYGSLEGPVPWPKQIPWNGLPGWIHPLSMSNASFEYHPGGTGREQLPKWIAHVAAASGRYRTA